MTENRKRVTVSVLRGGKSAAVSAVRASALRTVSVSALPVRAVETEAYTGAYEVIPDWTGQTLPTNGFRMTDDVYVQPIYRSDTSNPAGGVTVFIGPDD